MTANPSKKKHKHKPKIQPGDGDPRHGSLNGYTNLYCRCDECREAVREPNRLRQIAWRRAQGVREPERGRTHGTISCYHDGCRCEDCTEAARVTQAVYREKIKDRPKPVIYGVKKRRVYKRKWERERF